MKKDNKNIVGFRRVRGRVIPISGHIAGNAGSIAVGLTGVSLLYRGTGGAKLDRARKMHSTAIGLNNYYKMKFNLLDKAHQLKELSSSDFMSVRNATLSQHSKNSIKLGKARSMASIAIKEMRFSVGAAKVAAGLGVFSLGALAYQKFSKKKK